MSWHLWRILTLRPAYHRLSDTPAVMGSFLAAYAATDLLRWFAYNRSAPADEQVGLGIFIIALLMYAGFLSVCALVAGVNRLIVAVLLGAGAVVSFLAAMTHLVGLAESPRGVHWGVMELGLLVLLVWDFKRLPPDMRKPGYKARRDVTS